MFDQIGGLGDSAVAQAMWSNLDAAWKEAFRQAWEAFRTGNIPVGACASTASGKVLRAARNRVADRDGPPGEVFGSSLAHAEVNVIARLASDQPADLVLTTTLEPCLQCSAAVRLAPIAKVRFAGADPLWDGCHDFSSLSPREAARPKVEMVGPLDDEVGVFGTLISRIWRHRPATQAFLRARGAASIVDMVQELESGGMLVHLAAMEVDQAFAFLWPKMISIRIASQAS